MGDASTNRLLYAACAIAFAVVLFNQVTRERPPARERVVATDTLTRYARSTLEGLQQRSLANNQEYCGVIFEDESGNLQTSKIFEGGRAECALDWGVPLGNYVVASFHTHGGFDSDYDSERPSLDDLATDIDARIDGFIAFMLIFTQTMLETHIAAWRKRSCAHRKNARLHPDHA